MNISLLPTLIKSIYVKKISVTLSKINIKVKYLQQIAHKFWSPLDLTAAGVPSLKKT